MDNDSLNSFNPMEEDYHNPNFNSYGSGASGVCPPNRSNGPPPGLCGEVMVHVRRIPKEMTIDALRNLFSKCGKILFVYRNKPVRVDSPSFLYGKVTFSNRSEAERAISTLDRKPPWNLSVEIDKRYEIKAVNGMGDSAVEAEDHHRGRREEQRPAGVAFGRSHRGGEDRGAANIRIDRCSKCPQMGWFRCSNCKAVYCSWQCQKQDWPHHDFACNLIQRLPSTEDSGVSVNGTPDRAMSSDTSISRSSSQISVRQASDFAAANDTNLSRSSSQASNGRFQNKNRRRANGSQQAGVATKDLSRDNASSRESVKSNDSRDVAAASVQSTPCTAEVEVVVMNDPHDFYVQNKADTKDLQSMMARLQKESKTAALVQKAELNTLYSIYYDGDFFRGKVLEVVKSSDLLRVNYVDFGNSGVVSVKDLHRLAPDLMAIPPFALHCGLANTWPVPGKWSKECLQYFKSRTRESSFYLSDKKVSHGRKWITLIDKGKGKLLNSELVAEGHAEWHSVHDSILDDWKTGDEFNLPVINVEVPGEIWTLGSGLDDILVQMTAECELYPSAIDHALPGTVVASKSADDCWYRAVVLGRKGETVSVYYLDFVGHEEVTRVCKIPPAYLQLKSLGVHLKVDDPSKVRESGKFKLSVTDASRDDVEVRIEFEGLTAVKAKATSVWSHIFSELTEFTADVGSSSAADVITHSPSPPREVPPAVFPSAENPVKLMEVESPTCIMVMGELSFSRETLTELESELERVGGDPSCDFEEVTVGKHVGAQFSVDSKWYRAVVEQVFSSSAEVFVRFMDYGNAMRMKRAGLKRLSAECCRLPAFTVKVSLGSAFSHMDVDDLKQGLDVPQLTMRVLDRAATPPVVSFFEGDKQLLDNFLPLANGRASPMPSTVDDDLGTLPAPADLPFGMVKVCVLHVNSTSVVHVQLLENVDTAKCNLLQEELAKLEEIDTCLENCPSVGQAVAAKFSDLCWYRCRVEEVLPGGREVCVKYVDYGNVGNVSVCTLKRLPQKLLEFPPFAVEVRCQGVPLATTIDELKSVVSEALDGSVVTWNMLVVSRNESRPLVVLTNEAGVTLEKVLPRKQLRRPNAGLSEAPVAKSAEASAAGSSNSPAARNVESPAAGIAESRSVAGSSNPSTAINERSSRTTSEAGDRPRRQSRSLPLIRLSEEEIRVQVEAVESWNKIYAQLCSLEYLKICHEVEKELQPLKSDKVGCLTQVPAKGDVLAAKYSMDNCWYRCQVEETSPVGALVRFVDYGNVERVPLKDMKPLPEILFAYSALAVCVSLSEAYREYSTDTLKRVLLHPSRKCVWTMQIAGDSGDHGMKVATFKCQDVLLSALLPHPPQCARGEFDAPLDRKAFSTVGYYLSTNPTVLLDREITQITVTNIQSPRVIYCTLNAGQDLVANLSAEMDRHYSQSREEHPNKSSFVGELCAVQSHADKKWYRAVILTEEDRRSNVMLLDIGRMEIVENSSIKLLDGQFQKLPFQAIRCIIDGVDDDDVGGPILQRTSSHFVKIICKCDNDESFRISVAGLRNP